VPLASTWHKLARAQRNPCGFESRVERLFCCRRNVLAESIDDAWLRVWFVTDRTELNVLGEALGSGAESRNVGSNGGRFERQAIAFGDQLISATRKAWKRKAPAQISESLINRPAVHRDLNANGMGRLCSGRRDHFAFQDVRTLRKSERERGEV